MNNKAIAALAATLGGAGGMIVGALVRQPEINKLRKQVKRLQGDMDALKDVIEEQNSEIAELLFRYKALKVIQFAKRRELKSDIQESLASQYAVSDYLQLLLSIASTGRDMEPEEAEFYRAFGKVLVDKNTSEAEREAIKAFVWERHAAELKSMTPCDMQPILDKLRDYETEKPAKRGVFKGDGSGEDLKALELTAPDQATAAELRRAFFSWAESADRKLADMQELLDGAGYRLLSKRNASLSGMSDYPASEKLEAGDVLSVAVGTGRQSVVFADSSAEPVGYISGSRGYVADVVEAVKRGEKAYGIVESRDAGKAGNRNRVHVILILQRH